MGARPSSLDRLKGKNAALEAMIQQGLMQQQLQREPTVEEKIAQAITGIRGWARDWKKQLTDILRDDARLLSDAEKIAFAQHLIEVEEIYDRATKMYAVSLASDLEDKNFLKSIRDKLDETQPLLDAELATRQVKRKLEIEEAAKKKMEAFQNAAGQPMTREEQDAENAKDAEAMKDAKPTSSVIVLP